MNSEPSPLNRVAADASRLIILFRMILPMHRERRLLRFIRFLPLPAMKSILVAALFLLAPASLWADMRAARELLKHNQPDKAAEMLREMSSQQPGDAWLTYDSAVAAYASRDFQRADKIWQE